MPVFAAWGVVEWFMAGIAGSSTLANLTRWFHPDNGRWQERITDWKLWGMVAGLVLLLLMAWRELKPGRR